MTHRNTPAYAVPFPLATPGIVDERLPYNVKLAAIWTMRCIHALHPNMQTYVCIPI